MRSIRNILNTLLIFSIACVQPINSPPLIQEFICSDSDEHVYSGSRILLDCIATDPEGDPLFYRWTATSGTFDNPTASSVTWMAPEVSMESVSQLKVEVTDSENPNKPQYRAMFLMVDPIPVVVPTNEPESHYYIRYACDDAYVDAANPGRNTGKEEILLTGPQYYTYLRFDISDIFSYIDRWNLNAVEKVEIRLAKGYNNSTVKPVGTTKVFGIPWGESTWYEEFVTYSTKPVAGSQITEVQNITYDIDGIVVFNVRTDFLVCVTLHNYYSVMISTPSPSPPTGCGFYSKELKVLYPQFGDAATPVLWIKYKQ